MANNKTNRPAGRSRGEHSEPAARPQSRRAAVRAEGQGAGERKRPRRRSQAEERHGRCTRRNGRQRHASARLQPGGAIPAADQGSGGRACEADRARRPGGQGADDQLQPPARDLERAEVPEPRAAADRPDPGGHSRADPRDGEVRLAAWIQVLDVRHPVDQAVDAAGAGEHVPDDPDPGPHRAAPAQARQDGSASWPASSAASRARRSWPTRPTWIWPR